LDAPIVAISTFDVLRLRGQVYGPRASTPKDLRALFGLRPGTRILLVSVAKDKLLERYWTNRKADQAPTALAKLDVLGATVPNFSFFNDAPRTHTLWNRRRMQIAAEEFSAAGLPVVPHLNAQTQADRNFWAALLCEQPGIRYITKEFQTGNAPLEQGLRALRFIRELQEKAKRSLHPILIGGARYAEFAAHDFDRFTIVDSVPFMKTIKRQRYIAPRGLRARWKKRSLPKGAVLDDLLQYNVDSYSQLMRRRVERVAPAVPSQPQLQFVFDKSQTAAS
jgi:hypothetical protein